VIRVIRGFSLSHLGALMMNTRRDFLKAAALAPLAGCNVLAAADKVPVIDTHLHCFAGKDDARFPYHERAPYRPDKPATPEHLLKCMDGAGVDHAVVVHPEPYQDDHRYLEHCLGVGKGRLKGTCLVFADRPGSVAKMAPLVKRWPIVTVRIHAYAPDRLPPFGKPELRDLWKQAGDLGLGVQLHLEPRYAAQLEPYIQEFADIRVIIDHLGRPFQGTPEEHAVIVKWSRFKNTVMKLSSLPPREMYPHRDVAPIIKQLVEAFGPDRMIYGGGFSAEATPESYRKYRERAASYITFLSKEDQAKILGGTAAKLYGFKN
jgi:predicted TIM-barrel fold metal-dependent hydrolase